MKWPGAFKLRLPRRGRKRGLLVLLLAMLTPLGWGGFQLHRLDVLPIAGETRLFSVEAGVMAPRLVEQLAVRPVSRFWLSIWLRLNPELTQVRAGTYRVEQGWNLRQALRLFVSGKEATFSVTLVEGARIEDWLQTLREAPHVRQTLPVNATGLAAELQIGKPRVEGLLLAETYAYTVGTRDVDILLRARQHMQEYLAEAWPKRAANLPYKSPYEALIMASIIEKETGLPEERPRIASVFINRLRLGMRLQTDPTVIYGMGARYDGNIRKRDLQEATPYNTYVIVGLPPTPIAMPGRSAIAAALHPDITDDLYFVAKGGGAHHFSKTLAEHNAAVRRYILGQP